MDCVFIHDLKLRGRHGVHQHERDVEQEFLIDIDAYIDTRDAAASDSLADTANYSDFKTIAERIVRSESFYLIEKLADAIAHEILKDTRIANVSVSIRKPAVWGDALPGVTIVRSNS